ncbi:SAM-dependent methyltransferase [Bacillus sp. AFS055030]|uniref:SAM-dependent methyltransferase n=1 Tax=Bacillus sp. AFS055030 TaxID=2033507 RepID=UPI000BFDEB33|nr:SAM-dependent methyltransferase [Bacillus sp. AFS055030]PGL72449.1 SAM-dependent methyltransferase [Bacillus sp. AFS055030]
MKNIIINAINNSKKGFITYDQFISLVLYDHEMGYYLKANEKIGRKGDFYTTSSVGSVYGEVIAASFCRFVKNKLIEPFFIEVGGGNGRFASAFLSYCEKKEPEIYHNLTYYIIDASTYHRKLQMELLANHLNCKYFSNLIEIQQIKNGMVFSNELFDALPVRVVEFNQNEWHEVVIISDELNNLKENLVKIHDQIIIDFLSRSNFIGKNGQRVEIPVGMEKVYELLQSKISKGIILTVDYGFTREEWDAPHRIKGSLRGYYKHEMKSNLLENLGQMDITTHIHWDELKKLGLQNNIENLYFSSQRDALLDFGIFNWLIPHAQSNPFSSEYKQNRAVQSLIMPGGISDSFQWLLQTKDMSTSDHSKLNELILLNEYK